MEKKQNDCYKCPHRSEIENSVHSKCNVLDENVSLSMSLSVSSGVVDGIYSNKHGNHLLKFDTYGVKNGWCNWPVNFDPKWVQCFLPIKKKEDGE